MKSSQQQVDKMKQVIIMRGPPGSGKSTLISEIEAQYGMPANICSADHFFYFDKPHHPDNYAWNPKLIGKAHGACRSKFMDLLEYNEALIIIDNTNIKSKDFNWYIKKAIAFDYNVSVHSIIGCNAKECFKSNVHNVPENVIQRMIDSFAETPNEVDDILIDAVNYDYHEIRKIKYGKSNKKNKKERKRIRHIKEALGEDS